MSLFARFDVRHWRAKRQQGFTLIELMVVVAIVGILASIAVPSYSEYVRRSRVTEAFTLLSAHALAMEQFFQDKRTYVDGPCASSGRDFTVSCTATAVNDFTLQAQAKATSSVAGAKYTVNRSGARTTSGLPQGWSAAGTTPIACWVMDRSGKCAD